MQNNPYFGKAIHTTITTIMLYIFLAGFYFLISEMERDLQHRARIYQERGIVTTATATKNTYSVKSNNDTYDYFQKFTFTAKNPKTNKPGEFVLSVEIPGKDKPYALGTTFDVVYDPVDPEFNNLASFRELDAEQPDPVLIAIKQGLIYLATGGLLLFTIRVVYLIVRGVQSQKQGAIF